MNRIHTILIYTIFSLCQFILAQTHLSADPAYLVLFEKNQFDGTLPLQSILFRPMFYKTDTISFSFILRSEGYFNDNAPNQENMDVRYFSKGYSHFNSFQLVFNSPFFSFMMEPYSLKKYELPVKSVFRSGIFSVLNDQPLVGSQKPEITGFRNLLLFIHYKGLGFGWHEGNRWWGPGIHTSLQMTNNTRPFPANIIGTIQELKFGPIGLYGLYSFTKINNEKGVLAKYFTSLNGQLTWYGPAIVSFGFSRNYLSGGIKSGDYEWTAKDARKIVFEGIFTSNLLKNEYSVGGHDIWDQTLSGYFSVTLPKSNQKIYAEVGWNDNRLYFADFLSQPDHSMATIFGFRNYGVGSYKNLIYGFEWANLMISYSSRFRPTPGWYERSLYDFSTYEGRRWGAHSGSDSDDWYAYVGYLSDKLMVIPALNYERHGIVSHRPAEVKLEFRLDTRYKYRDIWFGIYYEKQFEAFLGFPGYFYVDDQGRQIDASEGTFANTRRTNTVIISLSKSMQF